MAGTEPLSALAEARIRAQRADEELRAAVDRARSAGHTWQDIGDVLGTSRQAAFQRFGRPLDPRTGIPMAQAIRPNSTDRALSLLSEVIAKDWQRARRDFAPAIADKLDEVGLAASWARVVGMVGNYERTGAPLARQLGDLTVVDVPLSFEAGDMVGRVSFDTEGRVAGLFFLNPEVAR